MTRIVQPNQAALDEAVQRLRAGQPVAFPTETVYGLGADASRAEAVNAVYRLKGRPSDHPLIVHVAEMERVHDFAADLSPHAERLMERFWPGPLTLVLPRAPGVLDEVTAGQDTVAVRMPQHPVALDLIQAFEGGLVAPSANRYGHTSPSNAGHVAEEFAGADLLVLDGGPCSVGIESTIVDVTGPTPRVLRPGHVSSAAIHHALGLEANTTTAPDPRPRPRVSGDRARHYAPRTPTHLRPASKIDVNQAKAAKAFVVARTVDLTDLTPDQWLKLPSDPEGYARALYDALRRADRAGFSAIWVEQPPDETPWVAVNDRLRRACTPASATD